MILCAVSGPPAMARRFYLESSGKDFQAIIIADMPTGTADFAARELQHYIKCVTGAVLPVLSDTEDDLPIPAVLVGPSRLTRELDLDEHTLPPEGFFLKTTDDYLVIAGNDHPAWTKEIYEKEEWVFLGDIKREAGTRIGTLYGVYSFLEEFAGVGWYFAGPLGEVVPEDRDVGVPQLDRVVAPDFSYRRLGIGQEGSLGELPFPETQRFYYQELDRRFLLRLRTGAYPAYYCNHSMYYWGSLFGEKHPEYFALVDGERTNDWGWTGENRGGAQRDFCWGSPAMIQQQIQEMRRFFGGEIERHRWIWVYADKSAYPIAGNDGTMRACECEHCSKWVNREGEYRRSQSDLYAYHLSEVAKVAAEEFPTKYIIGLAYGPRMLPPQRVELPKNVMMCLAFTWTPTLYDPETKAAYDGLVADWCKQAKIACMWEYTNAFRAHTPHMPLVVPHAVAQEIKARKGQVGGFYFCHFATSVFDQLELWLAGQLMWDADQEVEALIGRFFADLYSPAAEPVKSIYLYLEDLWREEMQTYSPPVDRTQWASAPWWKSYPRERIWAQVFTPVRMMETLKLLAEARRLARDNLTIQRRLDRLETGLKLALAESFAADYER